MIAHKFLRADGTSPFMRFRWELPAEGPGRWVEGPADPCRSGVHACRPGDLPYWAGEALYEIELEGEVVESASKLVAPRGPAACGGSTPGSMRCARPIRRCARSAPTSWRPRAGPAREMGRDGRPLRRQGPGPAGFARGEDRRGGQRPRAPSTPSGPSRRRGWPSGSGSSRSWRWRPARRGWPAQLPVRQVRVARPTDRLEEVVALLPRRARPGGIDRFEGHDGFSGVMLGLPGSEYHLEFTTHVDGSPGAAPSAENLLVLYFGSASDGTAWSSGSPASATNGRAENPFWEKVGAVTVEDPDGWRVVSGAAPGLLSGFQLWLKTGAQRGARTRRSGRGRGSRARRRRPRRSRSTAGSPSCSPARGRRGADGRSAPCRCRAAGPGPSVSRL